MIEVSSELTVYQKIKEIQNKHLNTKMDTQCIAKCFLVSQLVKDRELKIFVDTYVDNLLLICSVSSVIKNTQGKSYGFFPALNPEVDKARYKNNYERENPEADESVYDPLLLDLLEVKLALDLDETISIFPKKYEEAHNIFLEKNLKIDLLHLNEQNSNNINMQVFLDLLSEDGIVVVDHVNSKRNKFLVGPSFGNFKELFDCESFTILQKQGKESLESLHTDHTTRKLKTAYENILRIESTDTPTITVGIVAYNIENYIQECLSSIIKQRGKIKIDVVIFDDCSTDNTFNNIVDFVDNSEIPSNVSIQLNRNSRNVGLVENYHLVISRANEIKNDFFALVDGDDYFIDDERLLRHIDLLNANPNLALSFDALILYDEASDTYAIDESKQRLTKTKYELFDLLKENFMAACSVVCGSVVSKTPDTLFTIFTADWFLHLNFSQYGDIGFIRKPMYVYRRHNKGDWSGRTTLFNARRLFKAIDDFNRLTSYVYYSYMYEYLIGLYNQNYGKPFEKLDLLIVDDVFPHPSNGFRLQEYGSYLRHFSSIKLLATGVWTHLLGKDSNVEIVRKYKQDNRDISDKVVAWKGYDFNGTIDCKLAYICFLGNAYPFVETLERLNIPFVLELYPGGSFGLDNDRSDMMLERVLSSPCFRKVIVTQQATHDYLVTKNFCDEDEIVDIFGVCMPIEDLEKDYKGKRHFGNQKESLDICFVANKYTKYGSDKGYDVFIEVAIKLAKLHKNIFFHVVGGFNADVIDVSSLKDRITFYGHQKVEWFDEFYLDKDLILSPNKNGLTHNGAFDGFPTAACTDAGLRDTAIFCTDPLQLNNDHYLPGQEIEIIDRNTANIVERIEYYYCNPDKLENLATNGKRRIQQLYSFDAQIKPRIELIEEEIAKYPSWIDENNAIASGDRARSNNPLNKNTLQLSTNAKGQVLDNQASQPRPVNFTPNQSRKYTKERFGDKVLRTIKKIIKRILLLREVKYIRSSNLFDGEWYLVMYPDVAKAKIDPIYHYLVFGYIEGRNPAPWFDTNYYLNNNPDVTYSGINPFLHYVKFGQYEGRQTINQNLTY